MGSRMLRSNILQPPTRQDAFIMPRYDALEELTTKEEMFSRDSQRSVDTLAREWSILIELQLSSSFTMLRDF